MGANDINATVPQASRQQSSKSSREAKGLQYTSTSTRRPPARGVSNSEEQALSKLLPCPTPPQLSRTVSGDTFLLLQTNIPGVVVPPIPLCGDIGNLVLQYSYFVRDPTGNRTTQYSSTPVPLEPVLQCYTFTIQNPKHPLGCKRGTVTIPPFIINHCIQPMLQRKRGSYIRTSQKGRKPEHWTGGTTPMQHSKRGQQRNRNCCY